MHTNDWIGRKRRYVQVRASLNLLMQEKYINENDKLNEQ
jgi:hypothetical protein